MLPCVYVGYRESILDIAWRVGEGGCSERVRWGKCGAGPAWLGGGMRVALGHERPYCVRRVLNRPCCFYSFRGVHLGVFAAEPAAFWLTLGGERLISSCMGKSYLIL